MWREHKLGLEEKTLIWTRDSHAVNLGLSALPSVACVSYLCERDGVGKRLKVTQLDTSELEFRLG